jgi:predicted nucleic acid-binding protein
VKALFADTAYWIAVSNPRDSLHARVREVSKALKPMRIVTSEMVLAEFLNDVGQRGEFLRRIAVRLIERSRNEGNAFVVPQTSEQFWTAVAMYDRRPDKAWSLTDCASFQIMERYNLTAALTHDRHFEQAGFKALLRDNS